MGDKVKLSEAQWRGLEAVECGQVYLQWSSRGQPKVRGILSTTLAALYERGLVDLLPASTGSLRQSYALTPAGRAALTKEDPDGTP